MQYLPEAFNTLCFQVTAPSAGSLPLAGVEQFRRYLLLFPLMGALLMHLIADAEFRVKFPLVLLCCSLRISGNGAAGNLNLMLNVFTYSYQVLNIGGQVFNCWRVAYFPGLSEGVIIYRSVWSPSRIVRAQAGGRSGPLLSYEVTLSQYLSVTEVVLLMTLLLKSALEKFSVCLQWLEEQASTYTHGNWLKYRWADKIQPLLGQTPTTSTFVDCEKNWWV